MKMDNAISRLIFAKYVILTIIFLIVIVFSAAGCGSPQTDDSCSPALESVKSRGGCRGGEDRQFIAADLVFDKNIRITENASANLRITIGGERIDDEKTNLSVRDKHILHVEIPVEKVTSGVLIIEPLKAEKVRGITDESGKYAVQPFSGYGRSQRS